MNQVHPMIRALQEIREENGITRVAVARYVGVTSQQVDNWEQGKNKPAFHYIDRYAKFVGARLALTVKETELISTWADGFGRWHSTVKASPKQATIARNAIKRALQERGALGAGYSLMVELHEQDNEAGTVTYRERWDD